MSQAVALKPVSLSQLVVAARGTLASWLAKGSAASPRAPRDRAREAEALRTIAQGYNSTDPRYAADLFAAADRHEAQA